MFAFIVMLYAITAIKALPVVYDNGLPGVIWRVGRAPNVAFGFGSGFSSNIDGFSQSSGIGGSYQSGDASAYGAGTGSTDGNTFARGIGYAQAAPFHPPNTNLQHSSATAFNNGFGRFGSAVASARNFGNYGSAVSLAHSRNGFGTAVSTVQNNGLGRYQSAVSSAQNVRGLGYESAVSSASNGYASALSSTHNGEFGSSSSEANGRGFSDYGTSVAASQNYPGYTSSVAHSVKQQGGSYQQNGANSVSAPGIQSAQSHAISTDYY